MLDFIRELNEKGIKWEYVYKEEEKQLYIKVGDKLHAWYF